MTAVPAVRPISRQAFLGASEIAAVLGLDPYKTALDVFAAKVLPSPPTAGSRFTRWGLRLEAVVAEAYSEETGRELVADQVTRLHPVHSCLGATPDYRALDDGRLVEIKTGDKATAHKWGPSGTDQVPEHVVCQVVQQMAVCDVDQADVAVLLGGNDFRLYHIERDVAIEGAVLARGVRFWREHVEPKQAPVVEDAAARARFVAALFPRHGGVVRAASAEEAATIAEYAARRATLAEMEGELALLEVELKGFIGGDAGLEAPEGTVTWKAPTQGAVAYKAVVETLAKAHGIPASEVTEALALHRSQPSRRFVFQPRKGVEG